MRAAIEEDAFFGRSTHFWQKTYFGHAASLFVGAEMMLYEICVHSKPALNVTSAIHERQVGAHQGLEAGASQHRVFRRLLNRRQ